MTVPLTDVLAVLTPGPVETRLVRACFGADEAGEEAWRGDEVLASPAGQCLAALLCHALRERGGFPRGRVGAHLRAAAVAEDARSREYSRISRDLLRALREAGIVPLVVGGAALAETVYPHPATCHSDAITLVVRPADLIEAGRRLTREGFAGAASTGSDESRWRHPSGLPLQVRTHLLASSVFPVPADEVWERSIVAEVTGVQVRRLGTADALLQVCVDGLLEGTARSVRWVADAWHLVGRSADLHWDALVAVADRSGAQLPLLVALTYLADALHAPVPAETLAALGRGARRTGGAGRDTCLYATRCAARIPVARLLAACRSWRSLVLLLKWVVCPAAPALRYQEPAARDLPLPAAHMARLLRVALSRGRVGSRRGVRAGGLVGRGATRRAISTRRRP